MPEPVEIQLTRRYVPVEGEVDLATVDGPAPRYLRTLVTDTEEYEAFVADPAARMRENGVDPHTVDQSVLGDLARRLRVRLSTPVRYPHYDDVQTQSETSTNESANFDHSSSFFRSFDGLNVIWSKGHSSETDRTTLGGMENSFSGPPQTLPARFVPIGPASDFHPAQPLVTPSLVERIRRNLGRRR